MHSYNLCTEYTIPLKGGSDEDEEDEQAEEGYPEYGAPDCDYDYGPDEIPPSPTTAHLTNNDEDEEIGFSPNITLRRPSSASPKSTKNKTPQMRAPVKKRAKVPQYIPTWENDDEFADGLRHSRRQLKRPLEWWRNEIVLYKHDPNLRIYAKFGLFSFICF